MVTAQANTIKNPITLSASAPPIASIWNISNSLMILLSQQPHLEDKTFAKVIL